MSIGEGSVRDLRIERLGSDEGERLRAIRLSALLDAPAARTSDGDVGMVRGCPHMERLEDAMLLAM